jgi:hypothetical protein
LQAKNEVGLSSEEKMSQIFGRPNAAPITTATTTPITTPASTTPTTTPASTTTTTLMKERTNCEWW